jgi:hypothetical protein
MTALVETAILQITNAFRHVMELMYLMLNVMVCHVLLILTAKINATKIIMSIYVLSLHVPKPLVQV